MKLSFVELKNKLYRFLLPWPPLFLSAPYRENHYQFSWEQHLYDEQIPHNGGWKHKANHDIATRTIYLLLFHHVITLNKISDPYSKRNIKWLKKLSRTDINFPILILYCLSRKLKMFHYKCFRFIHVHRISVSIFLRAATIRLTDTAQPDMKV